MVGAIAARKFCEDLICYLSAVTDDELAVDAFHAILSRMQSRNLAFEHQLIELRDILSKRLEKLGRIREAAAVLVEMPIESGQRIYPANYKMDIYLRIAEFNLKLQDIPQAEAYVNRASLLQPDCDDDRFLLRFKIAYAHLLDHKEKFLEAGQRYAELSVRFPWVEESERLNFLERAIADVFLTSAGYQRSRLLATLYKDERCQAFEAYPVLEKMYLGRLINRSALRQLEPLLAKHYPQLLVNRESGDGASLTGGSGQRCLRLLELAMVEHNVLAASLIYTNTTLVNLASLLEISPEELHSGSLSMRAYLCPSGLGEDPMTTASSSTQISGLCKAVNRIVEEIENQHSQWAHLQLNSQQTLSADHLA